jgi:hypothetical protein
MASGRRICHRLAIVAASLASSAALACGFHEGTAVGQGMLNLTFPNALYVRTAVWQAQQAERLPRDDDARSEGPSPEARGALGLMRSSLWLRRLGARLDGAPPGSPRPGIALVLLGPVLWARFEAHDGAVRTTIHVDGPAPADAVIVTELAVVQALVDGRLAFDDAVDLGVARLYGAPETVAAARSWLAAAGRD